MVPNGPPKTYLTSKKPNPCRVNATRVELIKEELKAGFQYESGWSRLCNIRLYGRFFEIN